MNARAATSGGMLDAYRAALPADSDSTKEPDSLEETLTALHARGRAAYPDLLVDELTFAGHLARCAAPVAGGPAGIHAEDLYVGCAALGGAPKALERLRQDHRQTIAGYLRVVETASVAIEEIEQQVWTTLLVGNPPRLTSYSGRGPLAGFLGIMAQRIALDGHRRRAVERRVAVGLAAEANALSGEVEMGFIKHGYRAGFQAALREALAALANRERLLLRMHIVDGLTFERIAKVYGVSQATVSRWVAQAREQIRTETCRLLRRHLPLSDAEFESLSGLVVSQLDVSVSCLMRESA